jgi:hypothetical protein
VCTCKEGYSEDEETRHCVPVCAEECVNSNCTAPNNCTCHKGYVHSIPPNICTVKCPGGCVNGKCTDYLTCECDEGWTGIDCSAADFNSALKR